MADVTREGFNPAPRGGQLARNIFTFMKSLRFFNVYKGMRALSRTAIKYGRKYFLSVSGACRSCKGEIPHLHKHAFQAPDLCRIAAAAPKAHCAYSGLFF
ncbi:MAG: hypothetical protein GYB25_07395 [Rhodobacteraceae bacterium]|nr:hypothetical protein [Paracoccaceae bacterium]